MPLSRQTMSDQRQVCKNSTRRSRKQNRSLFILPVLVYPATDHLVNMKSTIVPQFHIASTAFRKDVSVIVLPTSALYLSIYYILKQCGFELYNVLHECISSSFQFSHDLYNDYLTYVCTVDKYIRMVHVSKLTVGK